MTRTALGLGLFFMVFASGVAAGCSDGVVMLRGDWGQARFSVELADTPELRAQGLMDRAEMTQSAGMLFVYPHPQRVGFWMRNTLISLDMLFLDAKGTVQRVHEKAQPLDETVIDGGEDVQFVLEINGGLAQSIGIGPGTQMRHPRIEQSTAAWRC